MIESIYEISYKVWNTLIGLAITLFTTSPKSASGGALYSTAHTLYLAIEAIALPICSLFFLIAIIRDVMQAPDGQKQKKMIWDMVKFGVIVLICGTLWELTGAVFDITDNITDVMAANSDISEDSSSYELDVSDELKTAISDFEDTNPEFEVAHPFQSISDKVDYFSEWIIFLICAISTLFITVSSCISILSSIGPLILER